MKISQIYSTSRIPLAALFFTTSILSIDMSQQNKKQLEQIFDHELKHIMASPEGKVLEKKGTELSNKIQEYAKQKVEELKDDQECNDALNEIKMRIKKIGKLYSKNEKLSKQECQILIKRLTRYFEFLTE